MCNSSVECRVPNGLQLNQVCQLTTLAFASLISTFNEQINCNLDISRRCERVAPVGRPLVEYDFVVIGGGAAGSVVASRLSEVPDWKVLLLEAGPDEPVGTQIPSSLQTFLGTSLDWGFETTNEPAACLDRGGSCYWPRGKNLGGSTTHYGMAYHRGSPKDYERWVKWGNKGWSPEEVLPYFKKSENNLEIERVGGEYHGIGGPMPVERFLWHPPLANDVLAAAEEVGYGVTDDFAKVNKPGFSILQTISKKGVRVSTAAAFLWPVRSRKNLDIALNATATKILIENKKAVGVEYIMNGETRTVRINREVIVSGGAVNSPQLLLLSGIGPKKHLKCMKVPVVHNLPGVGRNLHNHVSYRILFNLDEEAVNDLNETTIKQYLYNQSGPLSSTGLAQVAGVVASKFTTKDDPDIQIYFAGYQATCTGNIKDLQSANDKRTIAMTAVVLRPRSRGKLMLKDKDPLAKPFIVENALKAKEDENVLMEGLKVIFNMANSTVLRRRGLTLADPPVTNCTTRYKLYSNDYWRCAVHRNTRAENHQAGSCKMGPSTDLFAVVDPELKVHGIEGLRVADASVMPSVVSGNPAASIVMIGERAADFIKQKWSVL